MPIHFTAKNQITISKPTRLKRVFKNNLNYSQSYYDALKSSKNTIIGNIPDDFLDLIKKKFPENKKVKILKVQYIFEKCAEFFRRDKKRLEQNLDNLINNNDTESLISFLEELEDLRNANNKEKQEAFSLRAGNLLERNFKEILPQNTKIEINWLAQGMYSDVFLMKFLAQNNTDILHPLVLKVYKYIPELENKALKAIFQNGTQDVFEYYKKTAITEKSANTYAQIMTEDLQDRYNFVLESEKKHGIAAEANIFYYLKKACGKSLKNSNIVKFCMFDIKNGLAISPMIEKGKHHIKSYINLNILGLRHTDLKPRNIVDGVCIDIGGIEVVQKELTDKITRKIYKQINKQTNPQIKQELIAKYTQIANSAHTPDRNKIQKTLNLIK